MTVEANFVQDADIVQYTVTAAVVAGQVVQLPDGRAGVAVDGYAAGALGAFQVSGIANLNKTLTMVMLIGSEIFWDASANAAHLLHVNDKDFFVGTCQVSTLSADTTVKVAMNSRPSPTVSLAHGFVTAPVSTAGFLTNTGGGDHAQMALDAANEAQKVDAFTWRKMAIGSQGVAHFLFNPNVNGTTSAVDISVGLANATHATDADSITEHVFLHVDGGSTTLNVQSKTSGATNAAATTTLSLTAGTALLFQIDFTDNTAVKCYVNGVRVMDGTTGASKTIDLSVCTGPLGLLVHMEKTSATATGNIGCRAFATTFDPGVAT